MNKKQAKKKFAVKHRYNHEKIYAFGTLELAGTYTGLYHEKKEIKTIQRVAVNISPEREYLGITCNTDYGKSFYTDLRYSGSFKGKKELGEYICWLENHSVENFHFDDIDAGFIVRYLIDELDGIVPADFIRNNPNNSKNALLYALNELFKSEHGLSSFLRYENEKPFMEYLIKRNYRDYCDFRDLGNWYIV